jgi:hypothetical protein
VVHDITDETADDLEHRGGAWSPPAARWSTTAALLAALGTAAALAPATLGRPAPAVLAVLAAALAGAGWLLGRRGADAPAAGLVLGAGVLGAAAAWHATGAAGWTTPHRWLAVAAVPPAVALLLVVATPLRRGALLGGLLGIGLTALWAAGEAAGVAPHRIAAVVAVLVALLLGVLPRLALTASGLDTLDDRRAADLEVGRRTVHTALAAAHRGLLLGTLVVATAGALAGWLLAMPSDHAEATTTVLAALLGVVLLARARTYPLIWQRIPLLAGAALTAVALLRTWAAQGRTPPYGPFTVAVAAAAVLVALLALDPPEHVRAMARRVVDWLEALAVVAMVPVAVGVFGAYGRLLGLFH